MSRGTLFHQGPGDVSLGPRGARASSVTQLARSDLARRLFAQSGLWLGLVALIVVFAIASPYFITTGNLTNILLEVSVTGILAVGQTFVVATGGIDLSVGSTVSLAGLVAAYVMQAGGNWFLAILAAIAVGAGVGLINGVLIGVYNVQPFIVTFASLYVISGIALSQNNAQPIAITNSTFDAIGTTTIAGIPLLVIFLIVVFVIGYVFQARAPRGRHIYAVGANAEAARQQGIPVRRLKVGVYVANGMLAGLGAALLAAWTATGEPTAGTGYELTAIAAVVIGGTSLFGGDGGLQKTVVGVLIIGVIANGLNLVGVQSNVQQIVTGVIIVAAVLLDRWRRKRSSRAISRRSTA
jgi:ribose/xylose/arabinose/galactoside ABC-type transport system permease subunit